MPQPGDKNVQRTAFGERGESGGRKFRPQCRSKRDRLDIAGKVLDSARIRVLLVLLLAPEVKSSSSIAVSRGDCSGARQVRPRLANLLGDDSDPAAPARRLVSSASANGQPVQRHVHGEGRKLHRCDARAPVDCALLDCGGEAFDPALLPPPSPANTYSLMKHCLASAQQNPSASSPFAPSRSAARSAVSTSSNPVVRAGTVARMRSKRIGRVGPGVSPPNRSARESGSAVASARAIAAAIGGSTACSVAQTPGYLSTSCGTSASAWAKRADASASLPCAQHQGEVVAGLGVVRRLSEHAPIGAHGVVEPGCGCNCSAAKTVQRAVAGRRWSERRGRVGLRAARRCFRFMVAVPLAFEGTPGSAASKIQHLFRYGHCLTMQGSIYTHSCARWRRGRVAEGGGLLNRYTLQRRIEGSNPSVSASAARAIPTPRSIARVLAFWEFNRKF